MNNQDMTMLSMNAMKTDQHTHAQIQSHSAERPTGLLSKESPYSDQELYGSRSSKYSEGTIPRAGHNGSYTQYLSMGNPYLDNTRSRQYSRILVAPRPRR